MLQRRVVAVSREMATVLMRSSRSPIFNEIGDFVTVIFDRDGRTLAQTEFASIIAFGAAPSLRAIIEEFGDDVHDGDVFIHNDVFSGGNQFADVGIYMPVFHDGELVAWTAGKGHVADVGGMTLGGYDPKFREVWQEAFRMTPLRIHSGGEPIRDVVRLVRANVRLEITWDDVQAMIGACTIGRRRLVEVLDRYGSEVFDRHMDFVIDAAERQVRAEIERWPDGVYHGESYMQSDGIDPTRRLRVAVEVTIAGSRDHLRLLRLRRPGGRLHQHARRLGDRGDLDRLHDAARRLRPLDPDQRGPLRDDVDEVPQRLADRPRVPGRQRLRQPDVRRGAGVDHDRARRAAAGPRLRRLEPVPARLALAASTRAPARSTSTCCCSRAAAPAR